MSPVPTYPRESSTATPALRHRLLERIGREGVLGFPDFMAAALYDAAEGYYARGVRQVGREGDFFTSVSVGPVFGELLARRFLAWWEEAGRPEEWRILELGGHDGRLAEDVLQALVGLDPEAMQGLEYAFLEPLERLRAAQRERLEGRFSQVAWVTRVEELGVRPGVVFGNELLDALPFHVVVWREGAWRECRVGQQAGEFCWVEGEISTEAAAAMESVEGPFPEGYRTEVRSGLATWLESLSGVLSRGRMIWPDYGFARPDYYALQRTEGTLRTFAQHRAGDDPLVEPGTCDITAHVDFTAVAEAAKILGGRVAQFSDQGSWLTRLAGDWLRAMEGRPDLQKIRQFQTLVHPAQLGAKFQVLELAWGEAIADDAERVAMQRLAMKRNDLA